jgi:hypothetical protein
LEQTLIRETTWRKKSLQGEAEIVSQIDKPVLNLVGELTYKRCTVPGQPCPLGGCKGNVQKINKTVM